MDLKPTMVDITSIFQKYSPAYLEKFGDRIPSYHLSTIDDICKCRTDDLGGHLDYCDNCGQTHFFNHSCYNRSCPKCQATHSKKWLAKHSNKLLPVHYFHVVFTLPKQIAILIRSNPSVFLKILFDAVRLSLYTLMADPKHAGGIPAALCVLHTWTRTLLYHPHIHCLIPGVVINKTRNGKRQFAFTKKKFLVPVKALSITFRKIFIQLTRKKFPQLKIPQSVFANHWVVYSKPTFKNTKSILQYLSQYIYRSAITNKRIVSDIHSKITFKYQDSTLHRWHYVTLDALEFIRRYLQHVLPPRFHKVRFIGFLSPYYKLIYSSLKLEISKMHPIQALESNWESIDSISLTSRICPNCKSPTLRVIARYFCREETLFINRPPPNEKLNRLS